MIFSTLALTLGLLLTGQGVSAAASAGCGKTAPSSGTKSMTVAGQSRQYILKVPSNYNPNKQYKLIFGYHWLDGDMNAVASGGYYGLDSLSQGSAIFVAPNGLNRGWANSNGNDVTFTDQMLQTIQDSMCVDTTQIFATGWSYGGSMSFSLACSRPNVFRAVAVISGAQLSGCAGGTTPVPYLGIHGVVDSVLNINLGRQLRDKFLGLNGCQSKNAPEPSSGSGSHIKTVYTCSKAPTWWIAHSGDHVPDPRDANGQYWAPGETWSFFTQAVGGGDGGNGGGSSTTTSAPATSTTSSAPATTSTSAPPTGGDCAAKWGQCGGQGWSGPTCCQSGSTCTFSNQWYSQCL